MNADKPDTIVITPANMKDVVLQGLSSQTTKRAGLPGTDEKVELLFNITWDGALFTTMLEQASMHQSKNWYNNSRPSSDDNVMSKAECERRIADFKARDKKQFDVAAVAGGTRTVRERVISLTDLAEQWKAEKDAVKKAFLYKKLEAGWAEADKIRAAIKS